jgi:hypothetical protein
MGTRHEGLVRVVVGVSLVHLALLRELIEHGERFGTGCVLCAMFTARCSIGLPLARPSRR